MGAAPSLGKEPRAPASSVGVWLTSSLLPCHAASYSLLPLWDTQPASEALAASSVLQKDNFIMNEGNLLSGVLEPSCNCAAALSQPHTCLCNGLAVICSLPQTRALPFCSWRSHQFSDPGAVLPLAALAWSPRGRTDFPSSCSRATGLALMDVTANLAFLFLITAF